jgi:type VI secretion system secreted protein VgrG
MIIGDHVGAHIDCPVNSTFTFDFEQPGELDFIPTVRAWIVNHRMQTGKVTFWDHKFELPYKNLDASQPSLFSLENKDKLEVYDYPGGYSRKFDGIDKSGGEQPSELNKIFQENAKTASLAMEAIDARYKIISGASDCGSMTPGHRFNLINHPGSQDGAYVLTSVSHTATQSPDYNSEDTVLDPYDNSFTCIPAAAGVTFRPGQITPKPTVEGVQTATVVGPAGEEIFTDKYGRVKVQFHWDRHGRHDADSSCWMRVAQNWAGKKWGTIFIPRIGMEVIVDFMEGDPDQPIIIGSVYNADTMPPYTLPDEKTKSTIKSNSSKGGGGFNEFRIEDKKGDEQIFIHAEKDLDIRVKNDKKEIIKRDRHIIVENNSFEELR